MPVFVYQAMDRQGKEVKAEIEAGTQEEAIASIRKKGLYPTGLKPKSDRRSKRSVTTAVVKQKGKSSFLGMGGRVNRKQLTSFTRQLSTLQNAGLPVVRSLQILEAQMKPGVLKNALTDVTDDVQGGSSLSEAFAKHPKVFDNLYVNMVRAGEAGGVLDVIFQKLAEFMEKSQKLKRQVVGALIYPIAVVIIASTILIFVMGFIIPNFQNMFTEMNVPLPLPTEILINFSTLIKDYIYFIPLIPIVFVGLFKMVAASEQGRMVLDRFKLRVPLFGTIVRKAIISRFSRTLGTLNSSGVAILEALSIVKGTAGNVVIAKAIGDVHDSIREGDTIAQPLRQSGCFDEIVVNMIEVGEETGDLDKMLLKVADTYDEEVDAAIGGFMALFEPMLIIFMGLTVGFIVVSLFLPLIAIIDRFGQGGT